MNLREMRMSAANKMGNCIFTILVLILFNLSIISIADASDKVIIDPQYGGKQFGPIVSSGIRAKDIVLSIAQKLGKKIKEQTNYETVYTRESDNYVSLQDRVLIANKNNGNVLISIGLNSSENKRANGLEMFIFNVSDGSKDLPLDKNFNSETNVVIKDLLSTEKNIKSIKLAAAIHVELIAEKIGIRDRGIKSAPFYLLVGADMPSLMVMVGFLTNEQDEKVLKDPIYQDKIAEALFKGLLKYLRE